jgi:hypothetical protein
VGLTGDSQNTGTSALGKASTFCKAFPKAPFSSFGFDLKVIGFEGPGSDPDFALLPFPFELGRVEIASMSSFKPQDNGRGRAKRVVIIQAHRRE